MHRFSPIGPLRGRIGAHRGVIEDAQTPENRFAQVPMRGTGAVEPHFPGGFPMFVRSSLSALAASLAIAVVAPASAAAINIATPSSTYSQDFDSLSGTSWTNDSTLGGWSLFNASGAPISTIAINNGGSNSGSFYSFGSTGSVERALGGTGSGGTYFGSPASGAVAGYIAVAFTNSSAAAYDSFTVGFNGEQWRNGGNTTAQSMVLQYGFGATFATVGTWTAPGGAFNWASLVNTGTAAAVNGNAAGLVNGVGGTVVTPWAPTQTLWVRWTENNDVGNDHGLAIDNFSLSVTAVPETDTWAMLLAGLGLIGFVGRRRSK
jgi:MYXO-CTERM domain-containing protein